MKINGAKTTYIEMDVAESTILEAAIKIVRAKHNLHESYYLRDTTIKQDDPEHRHGSISEVVVREADEDEIEAFAVIGHLKALLRRTPAGVP